MDFGGNSLKLFRIISAMIIQTKCKWNNAEFNIPQTTFRAKELETKSTVATRTFFALGGSRFCVTPGDYVMAFFFSLSI